LTACLVNPAGTVSGTVNATGCDIGVYYSPGKSGSVNGAAISGANYFGVLVNGASVDVVNSTISNVGPAINNFGNVQYRPGGILFLNGANCSKGRHDDGHPSDDDDGHQSACGIYGNTITQPLWGKFGITAKNAGTNVAVYGNTIAGNGSNGGIAQNGIEISDGAEADIEQNTVENNQYTGTDTNATGILIYGGPGLAGAGAFEGPNYTGQLEVQNNTLTNNDVGVVLWNVNSPVSKPPKRTNNDVSQNSISNDGTSANIYSAGIIYGSGNGDTIDDNTVYGAGY